jgi:hypothetical protein
MSDTTVQEAVTMERRALAAAYYLALKIDPEHWYPVFREAMNKGYTDPVVLEKAKELGV